VAAEIAASEANIVNVAMDEDADRLAVLRFTLQLTNRHHLARVFRQVRRLGEVARLSRL